MRNRLLATCSLRADIRRVREQRAGLHRRSVHDEFSWPSAQARRLCLANPTFVEEHAGAEIDTQGVGRLEAEDVVLAVTGGYRNARGEATFEFQSDGRVVITYELDT
jgi:hypothetical protein